jgi:hypothetical protein
VAQLGIRLELGHGLVPRPAKRGGGHHYHRHAVVDAGDANALDDIASVVALK